jgi:hypothetical protein
MGCVFLLNERPDVQIPPIFLLTPQVLNATVPIEQFWNLITPWSARCVLPPFVQAPQSAVPAQRGS